MGPCHAAGEASSHNVQTGLACGAVTRLSTNEAVRAGTCSDLICASYNRSDKGVNALLRSELGTAWQVGLFSSTRTSRPPGCGQRAWPYCGDGFCYRSFKKDVTVVGSHRTYTVHHTLMQITEAVMPAA